MYITLLISKYLRRKLAPMFAAMAVTLCTAMVIIVISVMGGFLNMMRQAAQTLTGQVTVDAGLTGFTGHQVITTLLLADPDIQSVAPIVRSFGLLRLLDQSLNVEVVGIDPQSFDSVTGYQNTLHWTNQHYIDLLDQQVPAGGFDSSEAQKEHEQIKAIYKKLDLDSAGMTFQIPNIWQRENLTEGCVLGIAVNHNNYRNEKGKYEIQYSALGRAITLTVFPLTQSGSVQTLSPAVAKFTMVNEFKSGLYEIDANRVYVPLKTLQKMLDMHSKKVWNESQYDPETGMPTGKPTLSADLVSELMIKGKPGLPLHVVKEKVIQIVTRYQEAHPTSRGLRIMTWRERHRTILDAVEHEKGMITILFAIISGGIFFKEFEL